MHQACSLSAQDRAPWTQQMWAGVGVEEEEGRRKESRDPASTARRKSRRDSPVKWTHKTRSGLAGGPRPGEKASGKSPQVAS